MAVSCRTRRPAVDVRAGGAGLGASSVADAARTERVFTAIYYVNEVAAGSSGGELRLWPAGSYRAVELAPLADRLVVFDSSLLHEVLPNRAARPRCAYTQWFSAVGGAELPDAWG